MPRKSAGTPTPKAPPRTQRDVATADAARIASAPAVERAPKSAKGKVTKAAAQARGPAAKTASTAAARTAARTVSAAPKAVKKTAKKTAKKAPASAPAGAAVKTALKTAARALAGAPARNGAPAATARAAPPSAEAHAPLEAARPQLVRDSFTMPEGEYAVLLEVKQACLRAGIDVKKSELLRIGVALLGQLDVATLQGVLAALPQLKTGRPPARG